MRITPDFVTSLEEDEVFVFGSNVSGHHGAGAAKTAMKWGAKYRVGEGLCGKTYALPTVNANITGPLPLFRIQKCVDNFTKTASENPNLKFLVTEVGCGLAGLAVREVAPMFIEASKLNNVFLPKKFWRELAKYV
jgi:hypothetical protein